MTELYATSAWDEKVKRREEVREWHRNAHVYARARSRATTEQVTEENEVSVSSKGTQSVPLNVWGKRLGMRREACRA